MGRSDIDAVVINTIAAAAQRRLVIANPKTIKGFWPRTAPSRRIGLASPMLRSGHGQ
jgi:hypothetical protein